MENYKLIKKGEKWLCKWIDSDGKVHQNLCQNCKNESDAEKFASKISMKDNQYLLRNIAKDMYILGSDHMKRLSMFGKKLTPETVYQKRLHLDYFLKEFGNRDIRKLKISEIEMFLMRDTKHSGSHKNNILDTVATIYDETIWKCDNPVSKPKFQRFARNSKKSDVFNNEELSILLSEKSWSNHELYLMFNLIAACGLRISELRAVRPCQFLFEKKILIIDGFCKTNGARTNYNKKGSDENRKLRCVPLPNKIIKLFKNYISEKCIPDDRLVFLRDDGTAYRRETLESIFKRTLPKIGIEVNDRKLTPHSLRYTYVTQMRSLVDVEKVRKLVGHNSLEMTEYYTRFSLNNEIRFLKETFAAVNQLYE